MITITTQRVIVKLGSIAEEGALLFVEDELLAMVVYLEPAFYANDPEIAGKWSLEFGFGPCSFGKETILFDDLEDAVGWARGRIQHTFAS